jgi:hypothetical protein
VLDDVGKAAGVKGVSVVHERIREPLEKMLNLFYASWPGIVSLLAQTT